MGVFSIVIVAEVVLNIALDLVNPFILNCNLHSRLTLLFRIHVKHHSIEQGIGHEIVLVDVEQILSLLRVEANELVAQYRNALQSLSDKVCCCV
jgi:hypothetical protein